jgi:glycosyltransferase involved in cell wall biosynthesis
VTGRNGEVSQISKQRRLKILFLPERYPSENSPIKGIFVREHAKAASIYNDVTVLYAEFDLHLMPKRLYQISENIEDGITTIRVKYSRIIDYLKNLVFKTKKVDAIPEREEPASSSENDVPSSNIWQRLYMTLWIVEGVFFYSVSVYAAFRKLLKKGWKPDVIHVHFAPAGITAWLLGKLYRIPVIIHEQGGVLPGHFTRFPDRVIARFAMNRAKIIIAPSNALRRNVEGCGVKNEFRIVPNTVDNRIFYPLPSQKKDGRKRLLVVANLSATKGVHYLLHALAQVKRERQDFFLDIVGGGAAESEFIDLAGSLGLGEMVKFHGLKPNHEVARFMRECDFYILPSISENLPCVIIEAMTSGKPVVASDVGGVGEIVSGENGILIPPKDIEALTRAVKFMLDNHASYSPEKIAQYAKDRFSYEAAGEMFDRIYRYILGELNDNNDKFQRQTIHQYR